MTKILIDKETVELAREVIQDYVDEHGPHDKDSGAAYTLMKLDQALEQSTEQEPVAWFQTISARMIYWGSEHPGFDHNNWIPLYTAPPPQPQEATERNFCPRCGKRLGKNDWDIHTCTPPQGEKE